MKGNWTGRKISFANAAKCTVCFFSSKMFDDALYTSDSGVQKQSREI